LYYYYGKKKGREYAEHTSGYDVTPGHVTSCAIFFHELFLGTSKYQSSISGQLKAYFGGSKGEQAITHGLLEVTSPEAAMTGNDVT
jgi:hypothetical protein